MGNGIAQLDCAIAGIYKLMNNLTGAICMTSAARSTVMSKPNWDFSPADASTTFATGSFAEGASRRAYRAMYWKPARKYGRKAVVKEYKDEYAWTQGDWDTAVQIYEKTEEFAIQFNTASGTNYPIHIVDHSVQKVIERNASGTPKLGEWILVEDYLEGDYQKFISNSGWVKPQCLTTYKSMPAFAHWSWVHTRGQLLVSDLQGVRYSDKYILTDPCILSLNREYGATDLALIGMGLFFMTHQCTDMCRSLNIAHKRPNMATVQRYLNTEFGHMIQLSTSYISKEQYERLPAQTKQQIRSILLTSFGQFLW